MRKLKIMRGNADGNHVKWKPVAFDDLSFLPRRQDDSADLDPVRSEAVAFFSVRIHEEHQARSAVRIVFQSQDRCRNIKLVSS